MSKKQIAWIVVIAVVVVFVGWLVSGYNGLARADESVSKAWANVESQYQRRADLIPNLVETVKGYTDHESQTLNELTEARSRATGIQIDPQHVTPEQLATYQKAQNQVGASLGRLIAISENYPDLKASQNFQELQVQLEGTENRIQKSREEYNVAVQDYNIRVRIFPNNLIARIFSFERKAPFQSIEGSDVAPQVKF